MEMPCAPRHRSIRATVAEGEARTEGPGSSSVIRGQSGESKASELPGPHSERVLGDAVWQPADSEKAGLRGATCPGPQPEAMAGQGTSAGTAEAAVDTQSLCGTRLSLEEKQPASAPPGSPELMRVRGEGLFIYLC